MSVALYLTIWISLVLFAVGETGRHTSTASTAWAWPAFAGGFLLCVVHIAIAFASVHNWSHAAAIAATATRTREIYGLDWGGGVVVNYLFVLAWGFDAWQWRTAERRHGPGSNTLRWPLRIFYAIVLINAAVIFAAGIRRILGLAIVAWLLWLWSRERTNNSGL